MLYDTLVTHFSIALQNFIQNVQNTESSLSLK